MGFILHRKISKNNRLCLPLLAAMLCGNMAAIATDQSSKPEAKGLTILLDFTWRSSTKKCAYDKPKNELQLMPRGITPTNFPIWLENERISSHYYPAGFFDTGWQVAVTLDKYFKTQCGVFNLLKFIGNMTETSPTISRKLMFLARKTDSVFISEAALDILVKRHNKLPSTHEHTLIFIAKYPKLQERFAEALLVNS